MFAAPLALGGCGGVLEPQGPIGVADRTILIDSLVIMLAIVVPTIIATLAFAWWFRAGNARAHRRPDWAFSGQIELLVWSIPVLVVLFLGGVIWIGSHELDPARPIVSKVAPIEVQVVSLDWKWLFIYPGQGVASVNRLVIPAGVPVHFALTSASVMNVFFVPQLGSMIYTMNGMTTDLNLQADRPARMRGQSSHFSGDRFAAMGFAVEAVTPADFARWAAAARAAGPPLGQGNYGRLARQSVIRRPFTFRSVDPRLFGAIVRQQIPPSAGPSQGRGGPTVSPRSGA